MSLTDSRADGDFWRGRRVLLTGHTGFKGAWLQLWLRQLQAEVWGYALEPLASPNLWNIVCEGTRSVIADIRDLTTLRKVIAESQPHVVIHMAAQPLVRESYRDPLGTYTTNVIGTANVLQACRDVASLQCVLVVTSDKVYENHDSGRPFVESDRLGGHDPYSNSKACTELVTACFRDSFYGDSLPIASVRAGNVIGGGDWSADRLIPDCIRALKSKVPVMLRYPDAVRPWQHVLDPLSGYLAAARALIESPSRAPRAVNFGPKPASFRSVREVVENFSAGFSGKPGWQQAPGVHPAEAQALTLSSDLAEQDLGWRPQLSIEESLTWTASWYRAHDAGEDMLKFTAEQLSQYRDRTSRPS